MAFSLILKTTALCALIALATAAPQAVDTAQFPAHQNLGGGGKGGAVPLADDNFQVTARQNRADGGNGGAAPLAVGTFPITVRQKRATAGNIGGGGNRKGRVRSASNLVEILYCFEDGLYCVCYDHGWREEYIC